MLNLTEKERVIVRRIAESKGITGYNLQDIISNPGWLKMRKHLIELGIIKQIKKHWNFPLDTRHKQKYYWLTVQIGVPNALDLGVKASIIQENLRTVYNDTLSIYLADVIKERPAFVQKLVKSGISFEAALSLIESVDLEDVLAVMEITQRYPALEKRRAFGRIRKLVDLFKPVPV